MIIIRKIFKCDGCGKTHKGFMGTDVFPIKVEDWSNPRIIKEKFYCNNKCLIEALAKDM